MMGTEFERFMDDLVWKIAREIEMDSRNTPEKAAGEIYAEE